MEIVENGEDVMAEDFLYLLTHSRLVITDSFHRMCFSIVLNRPIYCIHNEIRGTSRFDTLREAFGLEDVLLDSRQMEQNCFSIPQIDYERINGIIEKERQRGRGWLKQKLDAHEG